MATYPVIVTRLMRGETADDQSAEILGTFRDPAVAKDILNRCMAAVVSGAAIADRTMFLKTVTIDQDVGDLSASGAQTAGWKIDVDELVTRAQPPADDPPA
jgi:methenyltetrahydromethanopterin cyclohydrolase